MFASILDGIFNTTLRMCTLCYVNKLLFIVTVIPKEAKFTGWAQYFSKTYYVRNIWLQPGKIIYLNF